MAYLQPWMLWVLPAVLLPIIIHLLNRLRYKTVHWAAMIFLLKANRAATRRAKIRQYLLLACRCLVILFLIWAMARPLVGGWVGAAAGGAPEAVLILLDRSASMEARAGQPDSKRTHALSLLGQAAKGSAGSRFVLIENVLREPLEIADASSLGTMQMTEATDTSADLPTMFRTALDYLGKNKPGSAELWIASDLQASNWRPDSAEWHDIAARFAGLPQDVRVRILDLSSTSAQNLSVSVKAADLRLRDAKAGTGQMSLALELKSDAERQVTVPLLVTRDGAKSQSDVTLNALVQRQNLRFDLQNMASGWGKVELPADDLPADNIAYFAYAPPVPLRTAVIGDDGPAALRLRVAAAPDKSRTDRTAEQLPTTAADRLNWKETALLVWTGTAPNEAVSKALQPWVESGGVILCFPPTDNDASGPFGLTWSPVETAKKDAPFRITAWDDIDGPLARTDSGAPLPLARLEILRRQIPAAGETAHVYGSFADGRPFLVGRKVGAGYIFACATLPDPDWGSFGEGLVMVPMVQRLLALGGQRLLPPALASVGEWKPADTEETWTAIETDRRRDWRWHSGVYQNGARKVALNRPVVEDLLETVERDRLNEMLRGVKLTVLADALALKADRLQSEIWPAMIIATMLFMCAEMLLATSKAMLPQKPPAKPGTPVRPTNISDKTQPQKREEAMV